MPILYFYLYNIFALYVVFVRLIHRAAPSHRIASIVRSATMHVFLCLSFKFAISRRAVISPNRFNRSIFGIYVSLSNSRYRVAPPPRTKSLQSFDLRHFMSLFQIRDIALRRHQSKSLQSFDLRHFMSLFQIRDIASRRHQSKSLQSFDLRCLCTAFYVVCGNAIG